jgi:hypothetical protein
MESITGLGLSNVQPIRKHNKKMNPALCCRVLQIILCLFFIRNTLMNFTENTSMNFTENTLLNFTENTLSNFTRNTLSLFFILETNERIFMDK